MAGHAVVQATKARDGYLPPVFGQGFDQTGDDFPEV